MLKFNCRVSSLVYLTNLLIFFADLVIVVQILFCLIICLCFVMYGLDHGPRPLGDSSTCSILGWLMGPAGLMSGSHTVSERSQVLSLVDYCGFLECLFWDPFFFLQ